MAAYDHAVCERFFHSCSFLFSDAFLVQLHFHFDSIQKKNKKKSESFQSFLSHVAAFDENERFRQNVETQSKPNQNHSLENARGEIQIKFHFKQMT